jgi:hypothetical protein
MRYIDGLPCDNGSTDACDSSRLSGILAITNHSSITKEHLLRYLVRGKDGSLLGVRHPTEDTWATNPNCFTRDQLLPLAAGLYRFGCFTECEELYLAALNRNCRAQNIEDNVPGSVKPWYNGPDLLMPGHMNHLRLCANRKASLFGKIWLGTEIIFNSILFPLTEPNVLISMCIVAGPKYINLLKLFNPRLKDAIREYWCGWRNESDLAQHIIDYLYGKTMK